MNDTQQSALIDIDPITQDILHYLEHHLPGYPFHKSLDIDFIHELQRDFPELDLLDEIKAFRWYFDEELPSKSRTRRASLRRWIARSNKWRRY